MSWILPRDLHRQFKIAVAMQGREMSEVLLEFVQQYVDQNLPASMRKPVERQKRGRL